MPTPTTTCRAPLSRLPPTRLHHDGAARADADAPPRQHGGADDDVEVKGVIEGDVAQGACRGGQAGGGCSF